MSEMKEKVEKCHPAAKVMADLLISGYQSITKEMDEEGLLTNETTFSEICLFAGTRIKIVEKKENGGVT